MCLRQHRTFCFFLVIFALRAKNDQESTEVAWVSESPGIIKMVK
jgi:hypothetical protein